ncbi:MAG: glycosyltransferase [Acidobacteriota bacterium]
MDLLFTREIRSKRIARFYGIDLDFTYRKKYWPERYRFVFETYDKIVVEGTAMKQKLQLFGCDPEKIVILHHGVVPFTEKPIKDFTNSKKAFKCLICGRFVEKKGFSYAVKALGELKNKYSVPVQLTIIGDASLQNDFLEKEKMLKLNREYNLNARFLGIVSLEEMKKEMDKNDFFLSPSVTTPNGDVEGGFPTTLIHAANQGMILVGSTHCDIPEIIHQGKNGYVSPERDVNALVDNLRTLSKVSPKELDAMSLYSYQLVRSQFNLAEEGRQLKALYTSLIHDYGQQEPARFAGNSKSKTQDSIRKPRG